MPASIKRSYKRLNNILTPILKDLPNSTQLIDQIITQLQVRSSYLSIKDKIIVKSGKEITCWLCGLRIYADEPTNTDAAFSLDHVVKKEDGGQKTLDNCKPAHRLCNSIRHNKVLRRHVARRLRLMKNYLRSRDKKDNVAC